ncbi:MAG: hypothetical protein RIC35_25135 [Marinoscillum sp.]
MNIAVDRVTEYLFARYGIKFDPIPNRQNVKLNDDNNEFVELFSYDKKSISICMIVNRVPKVSIDFYNEIGIYCNKHYPNNLFIAFQENMSLEIHKNLKEYLKDLEQRVEIIEMKDIIGS